MNLIGKMIGNRYEILEEVGNGGMAIVYKAKDNILNRNVAVKVLKDEFTTDADFVKRFNSEAQSAAGLTHPNIVSVFDVGHEQDPDMYYIVMELVKGKTLKEIISKDKRISWKWAVNITMQIASALEAAHKNGIVHRDIKPHNIIITEDGVAKVADFGIAKAVSNSTMTAFGTTLGSVHYFSPEQAKGSITDAKSDLYSLGVVMYEMLTGKVPFEADTPVSIALKHMQEEPESPIEINNEIPQAVNDVVLKAMQKNPVDRYQTATDMLKDLKKALKDPDGDFVVIENKDGEYTRVLQTVSDKEEKKTKSKNNISSFLKKNPNAKIIIVAISAVVLFLLVFFITKIALDGGIVKKVTIPNLVGMTQEEAQRTVDRAGLKLALGDPQASSDVDEGKIISQEPPYKANQKIEENTAIKIVLSTGPETTKLPDYVGEAIEDVRKATEKIGLKLEETEAYDDKVEAGKVIKQETEVGTLVKSGDTLKITVSKGIEKTNVPYVIGTTEGNAKALLINAKLKANVTYKSDDKKEDGTVISQSIDYGKEVDVDTTVDLVVNKIERVSKTVNIELSLSGGAQLFSGTSSTSITRTLSYTATFGDEHKTGTDTITIRKSSDTSTVLSKNQILVGTFTGSGEKTIKIVVKLDGKEKTVSDKFNISEFTDGGKKTLSLNLDDLA